MENCFPNPGKAHRRMRTVTNYFLVNLSAADLLMSVLNCIFNFIYMLHSDWPFGSVYCTISNFMANVTIAASVFTLMAISFDRYIAIVRPLKPRMTKSEARNFIIFIWASSMLLALPCLLYSTTVSIRYKNNEIRRGCFLLWPDGKTSISYREYVYNIVFFATTYLLPMLVMLISYSLVSCELWGSHSIGELTDRQANSIKSKRRVVRMFIVIVVVFMLCWLPQQAFFLYQYHNNQVLDTANIQHIYLGFYWLAMANAMVNPIIYYWMNARFRSYFREVVLQCRPGRCCCCCCSRSNSYLDSPHLTRRRCDSADHTSRSRSDVNGAPRCIVSAVPRHNNHLLVYSSRGKVNNRAGGLSPHNCSQTGLLQTDNLRMKEFNCYKPIEDKNHARKPLRAEEDWHYIQYLSDQKALRVRNEQTFSRPVHRTNGYQKSQQESLLAKKKEVQNNLTEETNFGTFRADKRAEPIHKEDSSSKSLPSDKPLESDLSKELTPRINVITTSQLCSGDSKCSASVSKKESPKELRDSSKESKLVRGNCDQPSTLSSEKLDTCSTLEGSRSSIATVSDNCESSTLKSQCSRSNERVDAFSDHFLFSSYRDSYRKMKYLNGNLVHQAIEETLVAVKKQALTREIGSVSTTNVVCKSPSGQSLGGTKELML
ncbi:tachykinin-like peptides receptor 99D isoform X2 [Macrobrachium nipponense]|uniref:tachykinin-like peptides receptor 99D isoform X2 n=1 Tax=Macrobrachium nipponense TaxID=159736 RepID=UPI0030C840FE